MKIDENFEFMQNNFHFFFKLSFLKCFENLKILGKFGSLGNSENFKNSEN